MQHFGGAIHLGMTATPKRTDNVDTYAYFCPEEPEEGRTAARPNAAFEYSLGQRFDGVEGLRTTLAEIQRRLYL